MFTWEATVRDYELDFLGHVNHAIYVHYFEQGRNDYARAIGIDFIDFYKAGYSLVISGIEIQYLRSLKARDIFLVSCQLDSFNDKRIHFLQEIHLKATEKLIAKAKVTVACVDNKTGRACMPEKLKETLTGKYSCQ